MMNSKAKFLALGLIISSLAGAGSAAAEQLRIGTEGTYKPWSMADANGNVSGFDADMGNAVCQKIGAQCAWQVQNLESLIPSLAKGRFDMIWSSLSATPNRAKKIAFSVPYAKSEGRFVVRKDSPLAKITAKPDLFNALDGKAVGAEAGTIYAQFLQTYLPDSQIKLYGTFNELLTDLDSGRLDAAYEDVTVWSNYLANNKNSDFIYSPVDMSADEDAKILGGDVAVGLEKGNDALRKRVNKAICELEADGTVKKLSEKWFNGADVSTQCTPAEKKGN